MNAWKKDTMACQDVTKVCRENTEACLKRKKPTPVEMANVVVHLEDPNEEDEVETVGALKDRYGSQHLAVWHC
jgi:hypothetical protein